MGTKNTQGEANVSIARTREITFSEGRKNGQWGQQQKCFSRFARNVFLIEILKPPLKFVLLFYYNILVFVSLII